MLFALLAVGSAAPVLAQAQAPAEKPTLEIYGFGQADAIVDFKVNNPDWYDVNRPSRLPSFEGEFGNDHHFYLSPRQSRFGAKGTLTLTRGTLASYTETRAGILECAHDLFDVVKSGEVKVHIKQRFALRDAADAHRALEARKTIGSTVMLP